jgi:hypothetical protein
MNEKRKDEVINAMASEDGNFLLINTGFGDKNNLLFADISGKDYKEYNYNLTYTPIVSDYKGTTGCFHND